MYLIVQHTLDIVRHAEMTGPAENLENDIAGSRLTISSKSLTTTQDYLIMHSVHLVVQLHATADRSRFLCCICDSVDDIDITSSLYLDEFLVNRLRTTRRYLNPLSVLNRIDAV